MLSTLKAFATRRLADEGFVERRERIWTRHGSTRYLWKEEEIERACDYVLYGQD
jgi:predicted transcriptional regulator